LSKYCQQFTRQGLIFAFLLLSMIKIIFFATAVSFFSCTGNNSSNTKPEAAAMPEEEKKLREAITAHPDSLMLVENLVQYFRDNDNYSEAIAETEKALQKDSLNEKLWYMKALMLFENEDTTRAITAWERIIRINPRPEYIKTLGFLYAITRDNMAIAMSDLMMKVSPPEALFIKGIYYGKIGEKENAIAFFNECLKINYKDLMAYREKAIAEYEMGRYVDALKTLELSLAVKQTYDEAYYWAGRCYEKLGKNKEAAENYQMALQFAEGNDYPEAKDALGRLGIVQ
jgi:tetratricopeptide (TPR) repeat protein